MSSIWLRIDGVPATEIAPHSAPSWETLADGGCGPASFSFALPPRAQRSPLRQGARVEIICGFQRVWMGRLSEPDRTTWECHARGGYTDAYNIPALNEVGMPTLDLGVAIATALGAPWNWNAFNHSGVGGVAAGEVGQPMTVGQLFDLVAAERGERWGVTPNGDIYMRPDPTTPHWSFSPGSAAFGSTDEAYATHLLGWFTDGTNHFTTLRTVPSSPETDRFGAAVEVVDMTGREAITLGEANDILDMALPSAASQGWVNGVTLRASQFTTVGGARTFLPRVQAGGMARVFGMASGFTPWLDVVVGRTTYTAGASEIYVEPVKTAARDLTGVLSDAD